MSARRSLSRALAAMFLLLATALVLAPAQGWAAPSPAGIVLDESETLTAAQLEQLDRGLTGLRYPYRVILLARAFPGEKPADAETQFRAVVDRMYAERNVPKDAVLVVIAMHERLVDIGVWKDGPINQEFREKTGSEFASYGSMMLDRFRSRASGGDIPGGILSAAQYIDTIVADATAPRPPQPATPSPSPYVPAPVPVRPSPVRPEPAPPVDATPFLWGLLGMAAAGLAIFTGVRYWRYRKEMKEAIRLRDSFLGDLLALLERELPMARGYGGDETRRQVEAAQAAADKALHTQQEGEGLRKQAEGQARFLRFQAAIQTARGLMEAYKNSHDAFADSRNAWAPVSEALRQWEEILTAAEAIQAKAASTLSAERSRTGWPLTDLARRIDESGQTLAGGKACRDDDPVRAVRLTREGQAGFEAALADLGALVELARSLDEQNRGRLAINTDVAEARRTLGLRFVELSPDPALGRAETEEAAARTSLPEGLTAAVRAALAAAGLAVTEARQILDRYREALRVYPLKSAELNNDLPTLKLEEEEAGRILEGLAARYAVDDWTDVRTVARDMDTFQTEVRQGLQAVTGLTSPAEQRYLKAVDLLDELLARRDSLRRSLGALRDRPAELEEMARRARNHTEAMALALQQSQQIIHRDSLRVPHALAHSLQTVQAQLASLQDLGAAVPLPVHRWERESADGAALAARVRDEVEALARKAAAARHEVERARMAVASAMVHSRHDRGGWIMTMNSSATSAEAALSNGDYDLALQESSRAVGAAIALEQAYRAYVEEQERIRRQQEEEERRRRDDSFSSGSSSSFGSSSNSSGSSGSFSSSNDSNNNSSGSSGNW